MKMTPNWAKSISYSYKEPKKVLFTVPGYVIPGTNLMTINQTWGTTNMSMKGCPNG